MKPVIIRVVGGILFVGALLMLRGERPPAAPGWPAGYADPAAVYCTNLGYSFEIQHGQAGDAGVCILPDASRCDAWDFLGGRCGQPFSVCARQGYRTQVLSDGKDPYSAEYAVCVDSSGRTVGRVSALARLEEKATKTGCSEPPPLQAEELYEPSTLSLLSLPSSFDWRTRPRGSFVTSVKDQGVCGSCWAFASAAVAEAALNIKNNTAGNNYDLSEQYLVSGCSGAGTCCGGFHAYALSYIKSNGIPDEACMPYVDGDYYDGCTCDENGCSSAACAYSTGGQCSDRVCGNRCSDYASRLKKISATGHVTGRDAIKSALINKGPLAASLSWTGDYDVNGVYKCTSAPYTTHVITIVGYDDAGQYWIAKNSWGTGYGDGGYVKVGYGQCLFENYVYYATVAKTVPTPKTPAGTISDTTPAYTWTKVSSATQYQYELKKGTTVVYTKTAGSGSCGASTCTQTPATTLAYASYSWRVRAYVGGAWKAWSASKTFSLVNPYVPVPKTPSGSITDTTPAYTWTKLASATQYQYQVLNGTTIVYTKTAASSACGTGTCTAAPTNVLADGNYTWKVRAYIGGAWKTWSAAKAFTVANVIPTRLSPIGTITDPTPTFTWTAIAGATQYEYSLWSVNGDTYTRIYDKSVTSSVCGASTCSDTPTEVLSAGDYDWGVRAMVNGEWPTMIDLDTDFTLITGFDSQFNGDMTGWVQRPGAAWYVSDTALQTLGNPNYLSSVSYNVEFQDFTFTARVRDAAATDQWGAFMIVRGTPTFDGVYNQWNTAYEFAINPLAHLVRIWKRLNGDSVLLAEIVPSSPTYGTDWNTMKVVASGTSLAFYVNDQLAWSGVDAEISSGQVGLGHWAGFSNTPVEFDWATLTIP